MHHQHTPSIIVCPCIITVGWHIGSWPLCHVWKEVRWRRGVTHLGGWWQGHASSPSEWPGMLLTCQVVAVTCCPFSWWCGVAQLLLLLASAVSVQGIQQWLWKVVIVGHGVNRVWFSHCQLPHHWHGPCLLCEERRGWWEGSSCTSEQMRTVMMIASSLDDVVRLLTCQAITMSCWAADMALACCVKKGEGVGKGSNCASELMWMVMMIELSPSGQHSMSIDMPGHRHQQLGC